MKKAKALPRIFSPHAKVIQKSTEDAGPIIQVVGIPYGGPEYLNGKDLHDEFFAKDTDFGRDPETGEPLVKELYAFYDHALNDRIGREPIGRAKFVEETDEGQIWNIEILRAYRYREMLELLAEKGLLGASSQPVQTAVDIDWETGKILAWPPAEISLTPTPANPKAVAEVLKSFDLPEDLIAAYEARIKGETEAEEGPEADAEAEEGPEAEAEENAEDAKSFEDEINDMFEDAREAEERKNAFEEITNLLTGLSDRVAAIEETLKTVARQEDVTAIQTHVDTTLKTYLVNELASIKSGIRVFAGQVATQLRAAVKAEVEEQIDESDDEREARREAARKSTNYIPPHAPGRSN